MSIKLKLNLLITMSLLVFALILSAIADYFFMNKFKIEFEEALIQTQKNFEDVLEERKHNLKIKTSLIAELPILSTVVENADPVTCRDSAQTYQAKLNSSIFDVFDYDGELLASVGLAIDPHELPHINNAVDRVVDEGESSFLFSSKGNVPCLLTFVPVGTIDEPVGALVTGFSLDQGFLEFLKSRTRTDLLIALDNAIISSTLEMDLSQSLLGEYLEKKEEGTLKLAQLSSHMALPIKLPVVGQNYQILLLRSEEKLKEDVSDLHSFILITTLVIFVLVLFFSFYFSKSITGPIIEASAFAENLANGDLSRSIQTKRDDEVGSMLKAMEGMRLNLKDLIENLDLKIDEKTSLLETESKLAHTAAEEAQRERDNAQDALQRSLESERRVQEIMDEVKKMVDKIKSFAKQTDMLALNATIEAVSAGSAGKSFGVVANEVQVLSKQINDLTVHMGKKIQELKST